jgi:hypothetical protein
LNTKINALQVYEEEMRDFPHPRSIKGISIQAHDRGSRVGVSAAEAFATVWRKV